MNICARALHCFSTCAYHLSLLYKLLSMFSSNASLNTFSRSSLLFVSTHRAMLCLPPQLSFVHIHFLSFGRGGNLTSPGTPECGPLTKRPRRPKELRPQERSWPWEVNAMVCEPPKEASTILYLSSSSSSSSSPPPPPGFCY